MEKDCKKGDKEELKQRIEEIALELFRKDGIKSVTMDHIARAVSISKKTLYENFSDKEQLLQAVIENHSKKMMQLINQRVGPSGNVMEQLIQVYEEGVDFFRSSNPLFFCEQQRYPSLTSYFNKQSDNHYKMVINWFHEGVRQGLFRDDVNYELYHQWDAPRMESAVYLKLLQQYSNEEIFRSIFMVRLRGITTPKGLQVLDNYLEKKQNRD